MNDGYQETAPDMGAFEFEPTATTPQSISILAPVAGDVWYMGTTRRIEWTAHGVDEVVISCSPSGGGSGAVWLEIEWGGISRGDARWSSYAWTIGQGPSAGITPSVGCVIEMCTPLQEYIELSGVFEIRAVTDADGDGMDDAWETSLLGDTLPDGAGDFAGDGVTDLVEFMNGSDPTDANDPPPTPEADTSDSSFSCAPARGSGALALLLMALLAGAIATSFRAPCRSASSALRPSGVRRVSWQPCRRPAV